MLGIGQIGSAIGRIGSPTPQGKGGAPWLAVGQALRVQGMILRVTNLPLVVSKVS